MSEYQPRVGDLWRKGPDVILLDKVAGADVWDDSGQYHGIPELLKCGWRLVARGARTMADRHRLGEFDEKPEVPSEVDLLRGRVAELEALCDARHDDRERLTAERDALLQARLVGWEMVADRLAHREAFARAFAASQGRVIAGLKVERDEVKDDIDCMALSQWAMTR